MNPLTNVKNLQKLNARELELGLAGSKTSWHNQYKDSAWIFVGGLPYDLTEGDVICVFSQYGEIVNLNMVRDKNTGKAKGFCFICYEDQRSTILAVDNLNGAKLLNRTLRVDHVQDYKPPKDHGDEDEVTMKIRTEGVAPKAPQAVSEEEKEEELQEQAQPHKKEKKEKKKKKKEKKKKRKRQSSESSDSSSQDSEVNNRQSSHLKLKKEKDDPAYYKYANNGNTEDYKHFTDVKVKREKSPEENRKSRSPDERDRKNRDRYRAENKYEDRSRERGSGRDRDRDRDMGRDRDRGRDRERREGDAEKRTINDRSRETTRDRSRDRSSRNHQDRSREKHRPRSRSRSRGRDRDYRR